MTAIGTSDEAQRLSFSTCYHQFYVIDPGVDYDTGTNFWTDEAQKRGLASSEGVIGISTASYGRIRCFFELANSEPSLPPAPWQRIVEASSQLTGTRYAIMCPTDLNPIHEATCRPGCHRLRIYAAFLDDLVKDTHGDDYFDFYWLILWRAPRAGVRVLKNYDPSKKPSN